LANRETLRASRLALDGVVQERDVGQRTTLDVLNAQATVSMHRLRLPRHSAMSWSPAMRCVPRSAA
jgi:outer membrane protein TolC